MRLFTFAFVLAPLLTMAQELTKDSVLTGPSNETQVWYDLRDGVVSENSLEAWHLGFQIEGISSSILWNSAQGNLLYTYPKGDISSWENADTTGLAQGWSAIYNADTSWEYGAFNVNTKANDPFDLGWGVYNMTTHHVVGDSFYVAVLANGAALKLRIDRLASGKYSFTVAELDGANERAFEVAKSDYQEKNFAYFNLISGDAADLEPKSSEWDLLFTKYSTKIPVGPRRVLPYGVAGVLTNAKTSAYEIYPVGNTEEYSETQDAEGYTPINEIGYDWKRFDRMNSTYIITDSTVYITKTADGSIWKIIMTDYSGSAEGKMSFSKQLLFSTNIAEPDMQQANIYPSFAKAGTPVNVILDNNERNHITVISLSGQVIYNTIANDGQCIINTAGFTSGTYLVHIAGKNGASTSKIIID